MKFGYYFPTVSENSFYNGNWNYFIEFIQENKLNHIDSKFWGFPEIIAYIQLSINLLELKPIVGDDYPSILRKMKSQKETMIIDYCDVYNPKPRKVLAYKQKPHNICLVIESFNSESTTFQELKEQYRKSGFRVYKTDEIFTD